MPAEFASLPIPDALLSRLSNDGGSRMSTLIRFSRSWVIYICQRDGELCHDNEWVSVVISVADQDVATSQSLVLMDEVSH